MSQLTREQTAVVESTAHLLAVDAFAGTGKTSTLVAYAQARPRKRILYIAFNKSVATDAKERFPDHVDCRTTHSLAYAIEGKKYSDKLGNPQAFEVAQACNCNPKRAKLILSTITSWLCSTDPKIVIEHVDQESVEDDVDAGAVVDQARQVWSKMLDTRSPMKMPHDGYLKLWAMSKPRLRYDIILLDEAQDTNPLTLELVLAQRQATIVLVGDKHQGIYGFRKALNAMELVDADERIALTQSFRYGQGIAAIATAVLARFKDEEHIVKGRSDIEVRWTIDPSRHYALIGRTNAGLFQEAAHLVLEDPDRKLYFVGGFDSYLFGKVLDAYHLWADERAKIKDPGISRFAKFNDFKKYGDEAGDAEVKALVKVVDAYRTEIPKIYAAMKAAETPVQDRSHMTLTTAHRAKGLEWEQAYLTDDFIELPPKEDFDPEEVNLLYVGFTRAIRAVRLPFNLVMWLEAIGVAAPALALRDAPLSVPAVGVRMDAKSGLDGVERGVRRWLQANLHRLSDATVRELEQLLGGSKGDGARP